MWCSRLYLGQGSDSSAIRCYRNTQNQSSFDRALENNNLKKKTISQCPKRQICIDR